MFNPFSSRCCQHNHTQGRPYYVENLWMATPDKGLAAVLYAASEVTAKVGAGSEVRLSTTSNYPFTPESTPLSLRAKAMKIPEWTFGPEGLVGELKDSPVRVYTPEEMVELIPMGAARIRITSFPVAGKSGEGKPW